MPASGARPLVEMHSAGRYLPPVRLRGEPLETSSRSAHRGSRRWTLRHRGGSSSRRTRRHRVGEINGTSGTRGGTVRVPPGCGMSASLSSATPTSPSRAAPDRRRLAIHLKIGEEECWKGRSRRTRTGISSRPRREGGLSVRTRSGDDRRCRALSTESIKPCSLLPARSGDLMRVLCNLTIRRSPPSWGSRGCTSPGCWRGARALRERLMQDE